LNPTIVFSHANGFPAPTYRVLFEIWRDAGYAVHAPLKLGDDPAYPVTSNWPRVRDELIAFVQAAGGGQPVHLVGHSLGGFLSLILACRRPDLAHSVVMLDSPVITGWRAHSLQVLKATGLIERGGPGKVSRTRRQHWPSKEVALAHFAAKKVFARWDPRVLADYVQGGTEPNLAGSAHVPQSGPTMSPMLRKQVCASSLIAQWKRACTTPCRTTWAHCCASTRRNAQWLLWAVRSPTRSGKWAWPRPAQ